MYSQFMMHGQKNIKFKKKVGKISQDLLCHWSYLATIEFKCPLPSNWNWRSLSESWVGSVLITWRF